MTDVANGNNAANGSRISRLGFLVRALRSRNYRLFFTGQLVSLIGTWLTRTASAWLVLRLTNSPGWLGVVGFAGQVPTFFLAPFTGALVDRVNRHHVLVVTQILAMLQSFALAGFALSGTITVTHVLILSIVQGVINAFDIPARQSFVVEMVENREDLGNAIALNSSMVNVARLLGPSIGGVLIATVGEGLCFLIDGFSYCGVILSLLLMRLATRELVKRRTHILTDMREGFRYGLGFAPIRDVLLVMAFVSLMGVPYIVLMPIFARDVLHGGPRTLGWLMAAAGGGALVGALSLAARRSVLGLGRVIAGAAILFGISLMAFSISRTLWLTLPLLACSGFAMITQMASSNTVLQTLADDDKRGRVMSLFTMAFMGMVPFGSLLAGALGKWVGVQETVLIGGLATVIAGLVFARRLPVLRPLVRPIYVRKGIIPEVAVGLQVTSNIDAGAGR